MTREEQLAVLKVHRENLVSAKSFEEWRLAHIAYLDLLIEDTEVQIVSKRALRTFAEWQLTTPPGTPEDGGHHAKQPEDR